MSGRGRWVRRLALAWAMVQLLTPAVSAIADGMLARDGATASRVHVEAPGSATCPEVHAPDCGVCRYLSTGSEATAGTPGLPVARRATVAVSSRAVAAATGDRLLPQGRAPPVV